MNDGFGHDPIGDGPGRGVDVADLDLDEELAALAQELHDQLAEQGDRLVVDRPPFSTLTPLRPHRFRQLGGPLTVAVAIAAVLALIVGVVLVRRDQPDPARVSTDGPATSVPAGPVPWHLALDDAAGFTLGRIDPGGPSGSVLLGDRATFWSAPGRATQPPVLVVAIVIAPTGMTQVISPSEPAVTVNGWQGRRRVSPRGVTSLLLSIDDHRAVGVTAWGLSDDEVGRALEGASFDADGRVVLAHPPAGLVAHDLPAATAPAGAESYRSIYVLLGEASIEGEVRLTVSQEAEDGAALLRAVAGDLIDSSGASSALSADTDATVEEVAVAGDLPAMLTRTLGTNSYRVVWWDPAARRTVSMSTRDVGRDGTLALVSQLRTLDEGAWQRLVACHEPAAGGAPPAGC